MKWKGSNMAKKPKVGKVTLARRIVQVLALLLFMAPVLLAGWHLLGLSPYVESSVATPAELFFFGSLSSSSVGPLTVLDPFAFLETSLASRSIYLPALLGIIPVLVVYGLVRGRAFCGWVCPMNLVCELVDWLRKRLKIEVRETPIPRQVKLWAALGVLVLSAILCVPVFEVFSPIGFISKGLIFGGMAGLVCFLAIIAVELFWGHRVWCRSLCPLGGFYEVLGKVGQVNIRIDHDACIHCGMCKKACLCDPAILEPAVDGDDPIVRAGDCMICGKCVDACPADALSFGLGRPRQR